MRGRRGERAGRVGARHGRPGLIGRDRRVGLRACSLNGPSSPRARLAVTLAPCNSPAARLQAFPRVRHGDGQARAAKSQVFPPTRHGDGQARVHGRTEDLEGQGRVIQVQVLGLAFRPEGGPCRPVARPRSHRLYTAQVLKPRPEAGVKTNPRSHDSWHEQIWPYTAIESRS